MTDLTHYIGAELARPLCQHLQVKLVNVTGRSSAGQKLEDLSPSFAGTNYTMEAELGGGIDIAFSAMPHNGSVDIVPALPKQNIRVVDTSADFRPKNADLDYSLLRGQRGRLRLLP